MSGLDVVVIGLALLASALLLWSQLLLWQGFWQFREQHRAEAKRSAPDQER